MDKYTSSVAYMEPRTLNEYKVSGLLLFHPLSFALHPGAALQDSLQRHLLVTQHRRRGGSAPPGGPRTILVHQSNVTTNIERRVFQQH